MGAPLHPAVAIFSLDRRGGRQLRGDRLLSFLWKRPQPVARVNVSTSAAGAKYFMVSVCCLIVEDPSSDRERIFLVSLRQFLVKDASA